MGPANTIVSERSLISSTIIKLVFACCVHCVFDVISRILFVRTHVCVYINGFNASHNFKILAKVAQCIQTHKEQILMATPPHRE